MSESDADALATKSWAADCPILFERYRILGIIGQGGMGTVFKGFHVNLKRYVAIKTLRCDRAGSAAQVARFRREMELVGQMDHPNVVRATDGGEKNGILYLVMDYLAGADLARLVAHHGRLQTANACELVRQAALGLDYIHGTLLHRDIKPSNLMLTHAGLVKVLDLGLARYGRDASCDLTPEGCAVGTFAYIAPEQAKVGHTLDARADLYSLGCSLFQLLTGAPPFSGPEYDSAAKQMHAHCHVPVTAVARYALLPEEIKPILSGLLAKDPGERFASGREAAAALAPLANGSEPLLLLNALPAEDAVLERRFSHPYLEELGRATKSAVETASAVAGSPASRKRQGKHRSSGFWRVLLSSSGAIACLVALAIYIWPPPPVEPPASGPTTEQRPASTERAAPAGGLRNLDSLPLHSHHALLDQPPVPIANAGVDSMVWNQEKQLVDVRGPDFMLLQLGTTSRTHFSLEAAIAQYPWSGNVGLFWGYWEDRALKSSMAVGKKFAHFQYVLVVKERLTQSWSVRRAQAALSYDERGRLVFEPHEREKEDVSPLAGEKILMVDAEYIRLRHVWLGSAELPRLSATPINRLFEQNPYHGALGVLSKGNSASFSKIRFYPRANN